MLSSDFMQKPIEKNLIFDAAIAECQDLLGLMILVRAKFHANDWSVGPYSSIPENEGDFVVSTRKLVEDKYLRGALGKGQGK